MPVFKFSTMSGLLKALKSERSRPPQSRGETFNLFEGCFTTHASVKKSNRECETALLAAESLSAIAGIDRRTELRGAWTTMLFNHFHDIFDGAAVHDTYRNAQKRAQKSLKAARSVAGEALKALAKPSNGGVLTVWNALGFTRTEPVRTALPEGTRALQDEKGRLIPVQKCGRDFVFIAEDVPAFSCRSYRILKKTPKDTAFAPVDVKEDWNVYTVTTKHSTVQIDRSSGAIGSYHDNVLCRGYAPEDAKTGDAPHDLIGYGVPKPIAAGEVARTDLALNVFQLIDEAPNGMSAWHINYTMKQENLLKNAKVEPVETGPVFARFRVAHKFRSSGIVENIYIYNDYRRVDFETDVNWREKGSDAAGVPELKVSFAASVTAPRLRVEGPFTVMEKPADGNEQPTQKFAAVTGDNFGFAILNDSKYGCDALGGRLRVTLLRNGYNPDPETDNGRHSVRFAFAPHHSLATNADLVRAGMSFNRPLAAVRTSTMRPARPAKLSIGGADSVVCTALRRAEHSANVLLRLFETAGKPCKASVCLGTGITSAQEVNFLENPSGKLKPAGGKVRLSFRPFEVKTLLVRCKNLK
ncbi:MAG TPA: hypothetical protein ENN09_04410 [Planctomycetes bacterium]|nr:hypothetical protein [Planctomycetota bacterium]